MSDEDQVASLHAEAITHVLKAAKALLEAQEMLEMFDRTKRFYGMNYSPLFKELKHAFARLEPKHEKPNESCEHCGLFKESPSPNCS